MLTDIWFANAFCFSAIILVLVAAISCLPGTKKPNNPQTIQDDGSTARAEHYAKYAYVEQAWGR